MAFTEDIMETLRMKGFRITPQREVVLEVLSGSERHMTAEEVYRAARRRVSRLNLDTVYRTLELLVGMGMVLKFDFGDKRSRYELVSEEDKHHHHHIVCTGCGSIVNYTEFIDQETELLKKTEKALSKKYGFTIKDHILQFYGLCSKCASG